MRISDWSSDVCSSDLYPAHYAALSNGKDADPDTVSAILDECAKFCEEVLAPINLSGDEEGCRIDDGAVTTPKGLKKRSEEPTSELQTLMRISYAAFCLKKNKTKLQ